MSTTTRGPIINDAGRDTMPSNEANCSTAPFIFGAVYRRIDAQTGLYEYGFLQVGAEKIDGNLEGTMVRHRHSNIIVVAGTAGFAEWELYAAPAVLPSPVTGKLTEQRRSIVDRALGVRKQLLDRLTSTGRSVRWEA